MESTCTEMMTIQGEIVGTRAGWNAEGMSVVDPHATAVATVYPETPEVILLLCCDVLKDNMTQ